MLPSVAIMFTLPGWTILKSFLTPRPIVIENWGNEAGLLLILLLIFQSAIVADDLFQCRIAEKKGKSRRKIVLFPIDGLVLTREKERSLAFAQ